MAVRDPNLTSGDQFCGNCGTIVMPGASVCGHCGVAIESEPDPIQGIKSGYIPYCRACGVPVDKEAALHCTKCGVTPLCREHFYPSTRSCSLCPTVASTEAEDEQASTISRLPKGPWAQPSPSFPCPQCGARLRRGVGFCPNCGAEHEGVNASKYAEFMPRLLAALIDVVAPVLVTTVVVAFVSIPGIFAILFLGYHGIFTYKLGQTPGKMLLGIQVVDQNDQRPSLQQIILREVLGKIIVFIVLFVGFIWMIWDPKNRGWHDYLAGTYVIRKGPQ